MKRDLAHMNGDFRIPTADEIREYVEQQARELLDLTADEAFKLLDSGELDGTIAEAEFRLMRELVEHSEQR